MGIEPTNNGFANRPPEIITNSKQDTYENQQKNKAEILPNSADKTPNGSKDAADKTGLASGKDAASQAPDYDPGLAAVVKCWPGLPEHIKQTIKTLIETAGN